MEWQKVGTIGKIGCFSLQQSKILTSGEGGVAITNDKDLYLRMEQARSDGRLFSKNPKVGKLELVEVGSIQGHNMCMTEFQAAILIDRLKDLDKENRIRSANVKLLMKMLEKVGGISSLKLYPQVTEQTFYNLVLKIDLDQFGGNSIDAIANAMNAELGTMMAPIYKPMNNHPLYNPLASSRVPKDTAVRKLFDPKRFDLPNAEIARKDHMSIQNWFLLDRQGMSDIAAAFAKVKANAKELKQTRQTATKDAF
ncbi:MAG: DegT/DnrJ/EryC1/StrS family aminotransferase [Patescibacteria group bacterium]